MSALSRHDGYGWISEEEPNNEAVRQKLTWTALLQDLVRVPSQNAGALGWGS